MKRTAIVTICLAMVACIASIRAEDQDSQKTAKNKAKSKVMFQAPPGAVNSDYSEFMRKVSENSAKMLEIKRKMDERKDQLYKDNPEIKKLWAEMTAMQKEIDQILESDPEYSNMVLRRNILWTILPDLPKPKFSPGMMGPPMQPK